MPAQRMTMRKIKDVLCLKLQARLSREHIATALHISKGVIAKYIGLAGAAGLDWTGLDWVSIRDLDETQLEHRLLSKPVKRSDYVLPDYGRI